MNRKKKRKKNDAHTVFLHSNIFFPPFVVGSFSSDYSFVRGKKKEKTNKQNQCGKGETNVPIIIDDVSHWMPEMNQTRFIAKDFSWRFLPLNPPGTGFHSHFYRFHRKPHITSFSFFFFDAVKVQKDFALKRKKMYSQEKCALFLVATSTCATLCDAKNVVWSRME